MRGDGFNGTEDTSASPTTARNGTSPSSLNKASISNVLNGSTNGHASHNGTSQVADGGAALPPVSRYQTQTFFGHDREETTRILIQGLHDLGYNEAAEKLSDESGYDLETRYASSFREAILEGGWAKAETLLEGRHPPDEGGGVGLKSSFNGSNGSNGHAQHDRTPKRRHPAQAGLPLSEDADKGEMLFLIRRQKYLELLEAGSETSALMVLREQLQPLHHDERQLHFLSTLLMCTTPEELMSQSEWDGAQGQSRKILLSELSRSISPSVMIPEHRLANLFTQVKDNQVMNCPYHNTAAWPSLYHDHRCEHDQLPLSNLHELKRHTDEVWYLQFSHDGTRLASAGKDMKILIYDTESFKLVKTLSDHKEPVSYLAWSPDDTRLITCSQDKTARLWDPATGICRRTIEWHQSVVTSAAWTHDSLVFAIGSHDIDRPMSIWNRDPRNSQPLHTFYDLVRVQDCAITAPTSTSQYNYEDVDYPIRPARLVAVCVDKGVHVYDIARKEKLAEFTLAYQVTCLSLDSDGLEMLVNLSCDEVWAIDLDNCETRQRYKGQKQGNFVIRSCFGGASEGFVVSGSEDSKISIWHTHTGALLEKFPAHTSGCVNAVAWNKAKPYMFASAGDDACVRVWVSQAAMQAAREMSRGATPDRMQTDTARSGDSRYAQSLAPWTANVNPPQTTATSAPPPQWGGGGLGGGLGGLPSLGRR